jgi:hypothetical protein
MITTATIEILSQINATVSWENTGSIGSILVGEPSDLYVKANLTTSSFSLKYITKSGNLPPGLTLNTDGTIEGKVPTDSLVSISSTTYNFTISGVDVTGYEFIDGDFSITVNQTTSTEYTSIWCRPYLSFPKRQEFNNFILDSNIFPTNLIYRPLDANFGIQRELKMFIDFGIEKLNLDEYIDTLNRNFYRRRFGLGSVKSALSISNNTTIYELIYIDVVDKYTNSSNQSIPTSFTFNGQTYYPASLDNMRTRLASQHRTTSDLNPKFTKSVQPGDYLELGYIKFVPLCYVLPGKSKIVLRTIKDSGFKFNLIDFDVDRILINNVQDYTGNKYLLLNRNSKLK